MFFVFLLYALFASVFIVAKIALSSTAPFFLVGVRMSCAGALMLAYSTWKCPHELALTKRAWIQILMLGIINIYVTNVLELWGLQYLSSCKTCFLYSLSPFLTALISSFILRHALGLKKWLGLVIGFVGSIPILLEKGSIEELSGLIYGCSLAQIAVLIAVVSSVLGWIILHHLVFEDRCPPHVANGYSMLIGGLCATGHSMIAEPWEPLPVFDYGIFFSTTLFLMIVSNIICYNLYGRLLQRFSPTFMSLAGLSTPLFTACFDWMFFHEPVSRYFFISMTIVSAGLAIFYFEKSFAKDSEEQLCLS